MIATHDQFTRQMRNRLKTTATGLGLVRLLQDAKRFEEAKTTLCSLENSFQVIAEGSDRPSQKTSKATQLIGVSESTLPVPLLTTLVALR